MEYDEAWAIYRASLEDDVRLSDEDWFMVDEALDYLIKNSFPGDEPIMIFNQAMSYYEQGYKELALKYFEYGADTYGESLCNAEAGAMCFCGDGVPINYEKALRYLSAAHENGWYEKSNLLAEMYEKGLYVEKDPVKAQEISECWEYWKSSCGDGEI